MIVSTRSCDVYLRQFGSKVAISKFNNMLPEISISPDVHKKEMFVFSSDDLKGKKVTEQFVQAITRKDPDVVILLLDKRGKNKDMAQIQGVNGYIDKPTPDKVKEAISQLIEKVSEKNATKSSADMVQEIEDFKPSNVEYDNEMPVQPEEPEVEDFSIEELNIVKAVEEEIAVAQEVTGQDDIVRRVEAVNKVADLRQIAREVKMAEVLKDITRENHEYKSLNDRLQILNTTIQDTMIRTDLPIETRLSQVRAYTIDQQVYKTRATTIIEEKVQAIVLAITNKTIDVIGQRLSEIDRSIVRTHETSEVDFTKVTALLDTRNAILVELAVMDREVREIFYTVDELSTATVANVGDSSANLTNSPLLNAKLRTLGINNISEESLDSIQRMITTLGNSSDKFKEMVSDIKAITAKMYQVLKLDNDLILAQQELIKWLLANKVEDTVIANDMLKKSMRIFTGIPGTGLTAVPLVLSHIKSRTSANTLLVDLRRDKDKYEHYGISPITLDSFMNELQFEQFCVVSSTTENTLNDSLANRLEVELTKAADYYRVINVVVDTEDIETFSSILSGSLVVNYIVDPSTEVLSKMKKVIEETKIDNVARRIIINKTSEVKVVLDYLGVEDSIDIGVLVIPHMEELPTYNLLKVPPYESKAIMANFEEASKYA